MSKFIRAAVMLSCAAFASVPVTRAAENEPGWPNYINCQAGFAIIFPRAPMTSEITYKTRTGASLPGRQYYLEQGADRMMVTTVQFNGGPIIDEQEMDHAVATLSMRGEVRFSEKGIYDPGFPGRQLNIFMPNNRQLRASVYMMERRLFIIEAVAAVSDFAALQFEQSVSLIDPTGVDYDQNPGDPLRQFPCRQQPFQAG
jgi:hypothetical protein